MALNIQMPQLGLTMKEGLIAEWKKKVGDPVSKGEVIFSVENDKATVDVEAQGSGVLAAINVEEMVTVPVGTVVGVIAAAGEKVEATAAKAPASVTSAPPEAKATAPEAKPSAQAVAPSPAKTPSLSQKAPQADGFVLASPLARQTAEALGINLAEVRGTGPEGAVVGRDMPKAELVHAGIRKPKAPRKGSVRDDPACI